MKTNIKVIDRLIAGECAFCIYGVGIVATSIYTAITEICDKYFSMGVFEMNLLECIKGVMS